LILAVGHLEPRKNFKDAIRAMARSGLEAQGWSLAIVGDGPERAELAELIARLGLKRTTIHSPTANIADWYARASLTLVTARLEVFSLVLAEAMLSGVVPIAYAADGPAFILDQFRENLVPMGDVDAVAEALVKFAAAGDLSQLRERLRQCIEERFSAEVIATRWRKLLAEASAC
jgi:glycosyltransferase involved in cell wall biosynthesis